MQREYQICKRCVMDTTDPDIVFDENGFCNHCTNTIKRLNEIYFIDPEIKERKLDEIINKIKLDGKNKDYDCIIGLSGGVDSSYLSYLVVKKIGLRPLAVHLDNGWNSELAIMNIDNIVNKLGIDLITVVLDWEEFREIQLAFFKSSVVDLELTSDFAIFASVNQVARDKGIKYFLIGSNYSSESIMPQSWYYGSKLDYLNIKDIVKNNSMVKLKSFPKLSFLQYLFFSKKGPKNISILDLIDYNKENAKKIIIDELNWRDYGGKHCESKITEFYQKYILPNKFNIDKRKAHLSSLICSGQIQREKALLELKKTTYDKDNINEDIIYFCKKIGINEKKFHEIMKQPIQSHYYFKSYQKMKKQLITLFGK
ncbi:MAG: N-acetyl sugar amidotransferase [Melioribacteraceae bacterium]|nr:N-acetyl sugar amidotransferase [Melioribacteraceae bacterium]